MEQNEPTATEKLREKIAQKFLEYDFDRHRVKYGVLADEILARFEEWAKEAGYKSPEEVKDLCQLMREVSELNEDKVAFIAQEYGYAKLAKDQRISTDISYYLGIYGQLKLYEDYPRNFNKVMKEMGEAMSKVGWRKVEVSK